MDIAVNQPSSRAAAVERFLEAIRAGEYGTLEEVLMSNAITRWPQSGEQITGAMSCIRV
jgi:hypothetical protein